MKVTTKVKAFKIGVFLKPYLKMNKIYTVIQENETNYRIDVNEGKEDLKPSYGNFGKEHFIIHEEKEIDSLSIAFQEIDFEKITEEKLHLILKELNEDFEAMLKLILASELKEPFEILIKKVVAFIEGEKPEEKENHFENFDFEETPDLLPGEKMPEETPETKKTNLLAVKKPEAKKPAVKKQAAKKPAVKKPAAKKPAVKKPAAKKPVAKKKTKKR